MKGVEGSTRRLLNRPRQREVNHPGHCGMLSLSRVLAPIDFSERSQGAARYAGRLAGHFHSELTLLHVLDSTVYELSGPEFANPAIRELCDGWRCRTKALMADFLAEE